MTRAQDSIVKLDILTTTRHDSGEIRVNIGDAVTGVGVAADASIWAADGFIGRPVDADERGSPQCLYHVDGHQKRVVATKDNRYAEKVAELEPGDRAIVTDGSARFFLKRETNQLALYTEIDGDSSSPMIVDVNGAEGVITLSVSNGSDVGMIQIEPTKITLAAGEAAIVLEARMVSLFADYLAANCGKGHLGVLGSIPPPPGANGIIYGTSGVAGLPSANWTIAP